MRPWCERKPWQRAAALLPQVALVLLACDVLEAAAPGRQPSRKGA